MSDTFTIYGVKGRTATRRRYVIAYVARDGSVVNAGYSDNFDSARKRARRMGVGTQVIDLAPIRDAR